MGGRFTSPAESRYSPIEGEALAVAEALHKLKYYVPGFPTLVEATNHKPLIGVFKSQFSDIHNPRLLSNMEKSSWFKFSVVHIPGIHHSGPDYLCSRTSCEGCTNCLLCCSLDVKRQVVTGGNLQKSQGGNR